MENRDFFDGRYFEISTRLETLRAEVAEERRAAAPRRANGAVETRTSRNADVETEMCAGACEADPSRQPA